MVIRLNDVIINSKICKYFISDLAFFYATTHIVRHTEIINPHLKFNISVRCTLKLFLTHISTNIAVRCTFLHNSN